MIRTERLILRRFVPEDWKDLFSYLSDPQVVYYEPYDVFSEQACVEEAARRSKDESFWAVCLKEKGRLIGNIYLDKQDFDTWELGFVFHSEYQGRGYAAESAGALIDDAVDNRRLRRLIAMCNPENRKSWRLLERLGMRREGHLIQNVFFRRDGSGMPVWQDTYLYGQLAGERKKRPQ
jgi:RimJ/RimL family protein N-acetyltransferase